MDTILRTHSRLELLHPHHGLAQRHSLSCARPPRGNQDAKVGAAKRPTYKWSGVACARAAGGGSGLLELVPETKKENLDFDLLMYDPSKGATVDLAVVGGGPAGLAVAQQVSQEGLSVCIIDPSPKLIWPNNYGVWVDEFKAMDMLDCLDTIWPGAVVHVDEATEKHLGRPYGRVNRKQLKSKMMQKCLLNGVRFHQAKVLKVIHEESKSFLICNDGATLQASLVLDATGFSRSLVQYDKPYNPGYQVAYGILAEVAEHPFDLDKMLFMDWRDSHLDGKKKLKERNSRIPTFLYAMPFSSNRIFLEETSLVARPGLAMEAKRVRSGSPGNGGSYPMCQVDDCRADLSNAKDYHRRHKVCEVHSKTTKAMVGKHMQRFCQQCSRFHMLAEFDEGKRSCRRRLAGHNRRRRKTQPEDVSSRPIPPSNQENPGSANLNIVNLLTILAQLQGNGVDKPSSSSLPDKGRLVQVLGKINSLPSLDSSIKTPKAVDFDLNVSQTSQISFEHSSKTDGNLPAPLTMDLLAVLSAALKAPAVNNVADFSQGSSESSGNERTKVHPEEFVSDGNVQTKSPEFSSVAVGGSDCALQSSTEISEHSVNPSLRLQLLSSIEDDSPPEMGSSSKYQYAESRNPINNKSPSSSPPDLWRLFPLQSEAESLKHNQISIIRDHDGMIEASNKNEGRGSVLELSRHSGRRVENCTILSVPYQAGYTSSSGSDQSPSSSNSDSQERTGRIIFKLFGKDPSSFPVTLRMQILSWLSHSPSDMESYIRPGCVVLSVYLSMPSSAWDELQEDLIQRINLLVQHSDSDFWRNGRFLIYLDGQLASHKGGKIRLCRTWRTWRAPEIISVSPLAVVSGREISLVLRGRNLNVPGTKIHCTYMGCYTSKEVPMSSEPGRIYDDSSIECFNFPGGAPSAFGRCFLEVENGFKGNSFPVIIADDKICQELRHLELEFENDVKSSDIMQEDQVYDCARRQSREDVLHFLNELGWLFQRSSIESYPLLENFSNARFKFLFIFAVERDWTALIRKLLDILVERSSRNVELVQESLETLSEIQLLHRAVKRKCRKMVDLLLHYSVSHGIDSSKLYLFLPNTVGPGGVTPLHLAASTQDSEDIVDGLTDDPQEIGLNCWSSVVDGNGQSPYTYALMRNNHSYNKLVSRKLADRRNDQVSITVESEMDLKKPESSREVEKPKLGSLDTMCSRCAIMERRRIKTTLRPQGLLRYPFLNPILGIAAVCLCVCLIIRGAPEMGPVAPFKWENLDFGTS